MKIKEILVKSIITCGVCSSKNFEDIWDLPKFPLTEAFGEFDRNYPCIDQKLVLCLECGHLQLGEQVDPNFLYQTVNYNFRTVLNTKIDRELSFFMKFVQELGKDLKALNALEIGASNIILAKKLQPLFKSISVCDPLFKDSHESMIEGISLVGQLAEESLNFIIESDIRVILGRHVLEHVMDPFSLLSELVEGMPEESLFIFEVPSLKHLRAGQRFDAIFHQHCQYFDEKSVRDIVNRLDCKLEKMTFNGDGSNGGSLLFAFSKPKLPTKEKLLELDQIGVIGNKKFDLANEVSTFVSIMDNFAVLLNNTNQIKYGYGAGHMLATLDYHLSGEIAKFRGILDDDEEKHGLTYKNIPTKVYFPGKLELSDDDCFFVTSLENRRAITRNIINNYPNKILGSFLI